MDQRSNNLMRIRPEILSAKINNLTGKNECFQNKTLRPIIKLQLFLFIAVFKNYINKHKNKFYDFSQENRLKYIENAIQKDIKLRNSLKGMLIGQFTIEEYQEYIQNSSALNKRMMHMVIELLKNNLQLLEEEILTY